MSRIVQKISGTQTAKTSNAVKAIARKTSELAIDQRINKWEKYREQWGRDGRNKENMVIASRAARWEARLGSRQRSSSAVDGSAASPDGSSDLKGQGQKKRIYRGELRNDIN